MKETDDYIFGIRCNGVSVEVSLISIDEDQSKFDYICNVFLENFYNGNGTYNISIVNKDNIPGMAVGKWRIKKAWIRFDWGCSKSKLIMEDPDGSETCELLADSQKGSASSQSFDVPSLARTIFSKAQSIVRDYPNAKVYNAVAELQELKRSLRFASLSRQDDGSERYISDIEFALRKLVQYLNVYKTTRDLLSKEEDQRSQLLFKDLSAECRHLLLELKNEIINNG